VTDVIALLEDVESGPVDLQQEEGPVDGLQFVEVNQQVEDSVEELMLFRRQSPVKDRALVQARAKRGSHGKI